MNLRARLLLAQGPLAVALALVGAVAVFTVAQLARSGQTILHANYRSVLAAQRMKEAIERVDSAAMFMVIGERERGLAQAAEFQPKFETELQVQEHNITEPGEEAATAQLRQYWEQYRAQFNDFKAANDQEAFRAYYTRTLNLSFVRVKDAAARVLDLNQDAMVRKSDSIRKRGEQVNRLMISGVLAAFIVGVWFSSTLTSRALRPMSVLSQAVRRLGEGDLEARARIEDRSELGQLASDFNAMADRLKGYQQSSLGELLQAQQASQAAIDSLPDPVIVFGLESGVLNVNESASRMLGLDLETSGDPISKTTPEVREVLQRVRAHVLGGKGPYVPKGYEEAVRVDAADGHHFFLPRGAPIYGEDRTITAATVILEDVTRLKRLDELKNDLVATVAHEFRTPLTSLRMAIHLCLEEAVGPLSEKQADLLQAAREDCERLQGIVDDLLDLSSIQAGRLALETHPVSPLELLDRVVPGHRFQLDQKHLQLEASTAPDVGMLDVDVDRLALALGNLVGNAVRHTPEGGRVAIHVRREGSRGLVEVTDTGSGIAPEHQKRIFEKFYRIPGSSSGGAGLGLSIAREIVEAHGGEIGLDSRPGHGSRFWFTVPLAVSAT